MSGKSICTVEWNPFTTAQQVEIALYNVGKLVSKAVEKCFMERQRNPQKHTNDAEKQKKDHGWHNMSSVKYCSASILASVYRMAASELAQWQIMYDFTAAGRVAQKLRDAQIRPNIKPLWENFIIEQGQNPQHMAKTAKEDWSEPWLSRSFISLRLIKKTR